MCNGKYGRMGLVGSDSPISWARVGKPLDGLVVWLDYISLQFARGHVIQFFAFPKHLCRCTFLLFYVPVGLGSKAYSRLWYVGSCFASRKPQCPGATWPRACDCRASELSCVDPPSMNPDAT